MKSLRLLLLLLALLVAGPPRPPALRVSFTRLTRAAYERARRQAPAVHELGRGEKPTFPVRKQHGRLVIPTAAGNRVFQDKIHPQDETEDVTYVYQGFFASCQLHLVLVQYYESSEMLLVEPSGNVESLTSAPMYAPGRQRLLTASRGLVYAMMPNQLQVAERVNGAIRVVWQLTPRHWEPAQAFWTSDSTFCVKQEQINPATEAPFEPSRFTYAQLLLRPAVPGSK